MTLALFIYTIEDVLVALVLVLLPVLIGLAFAIDWIATVVAKWRNRR